MRNRVSMHVEKLESRATPSVTSATSGVLLPPGVVRAIGDPNQAPPPPPVQVGAGGGLVFLPPGVVRAIGDTDLAPQT
jgi:hypothetical protein